MSLLKSGFAFASQLAWPVAGAAALAAAVFDPSPSDPLAVGSKVREIQDRGQAWTWEVVGRTDAGLYELRRGTVLTLVEPWEVVMLE